MYVTLEEFDKLVKKVESFRKIRSACHGTMTKMKDQFKELQDKVEHLENTMNKNNLDDIESSIEKIKEEQKVNCDGIIAIDKKLLSLQEEQIGIKSNVETNSKKYHDDLKELEGKFTHFSSEKAAIENSATNEIDYKCKICSSCFQNRRSLTSHIKVQHPKIISCNLCEKKFEKNSELENHLDADHGETKKFKCDLCDMSFILKWRLNKHVEGHKETRICHYFNNNEKCPFVKVGCKFVHKTASVCRYADQCQRTKCQFRHV